MIFLFFGISLKASAQLKVWAYPDTLHFELVEPNQMIEINMDTISFKAGKMPGRLTIYFTVDVVDSLTIVTRSFTNDPHIICSYPYQPLKSDTVYSCAICFARKIGLDRRNLGLIFNGDKRVTFRWRAYWKQLAENEE
ncbi:hypothetical protein K6119_06810 [Paracrocinitomix mangrovi]|uniref:hypothetical protein n=1 Tax=Paracrocinitomix mangrovi TaxID=2862509 RepID=UPI001EDA5083|nr:hypothetical protein [Paracrocinitomix mangrovi]UKN03224.1 hypothetical protein K6119_06810 [Paracrocinitomix mangrovi]